jgi:hypothetical protein
VPRKPKAPASPGPRAARGIAEQENLPNPNPFWKGGEEIVEEPVADVVGLDFLARLAEIAA